MEFVCVQNLFNEFFEQCSQHCGRKGRQIRRLFCLDRRGAKVRRRLCPVESRPQRRRKCNQRPCTGPTTCLEVKNRLKTNVDGEYTLFIAGRYMPIYCHGMDGVEPTEYLTLPAGERENYAEIYDKRSSYILQISFFHLILFISRSKIILVLIFL